MEAKVAKTLMEAYASVYDQPEQIDEGITSVVKDPKENKGPSPTYKGPRIKMGPGVRERFPKGGPGIVGAFKKLKKNLTKEGVDVFDIVKGYLMTEHDLTEELALKVMLELEDEHRDAILEAVGIVGPPKKAIDKIPGVRNVRIGLANAVKRLDYGHNDEIKQVGKHVVPTPRMGGKFDRPGGTKYKDISGDK